MKILTISKYISLAAVLLSTSAYTSEPAKIRPVTTDNQGIWQPDLGNGKYQNPVLNGDYSDPDVVRVGDDFYLTSSSFGFVPGLPVLHSKDLVNWSVVSYALPIPPKAEHFSAPRHGGGVWAPTIRYHNNQFMIYYADPDWGTYVVTAKSASGPWSEPVLVDDTLGLIDPAPFWDEDGQGYLAYAYANSRSGKHNIIELKKLSADGKKTYGEPKIIINGADYPKVKTSQGDMPWFTIEGPKLYKRGEYYYIFAPAGSVKAGWQGVFRAKNINGPYQARQVMDQGSTDINGPHQGAWVTTESGEDWFLHFQDTDSYGRRVFLQPMQWQKNGWPLIGKRQGNEAYGEPVWQYQKPNVAKQPVTTPVVNDDFDNGFNLSWQWSALPRADWVDTSVKGKLRLKSVSSSENLWQAGNLLTQKLPGMAFSAITKLEMQPKRVGERAGLLVLGYGYSWIGLENTTDGLRLVRVNRPEAHEFADENVLTAPVKIERAVYLKMKVEPVVVTEHEPDYPAYFDSMLRSYRAKVQYFYSLNGQDYHALGSPIIAEQGRWVGTKIGLFAQASSNTPAYVSTTVGYSDFEFFKVIK
ncbi:glycoside hydrolase 43 family protein [Catenovulum sp. 2E275]|uniref:glycoside hydrolase family 43 protein n=1 Tax=Catenovulum sp. 2E275 TaxID=2980497 RepID=UPI0021D36683|nr:glycoside hydrolase 43 family protein [Catenovulum sp. 2E275]MCU4677343.1 glycoside hydrolase 43 family protein [Catenovulum sp. 2E275]